MENNFKISESGSSYILYDADIIAKPEVELFDGDYHINRLEQQKKSTSSSTATPTGIGRARVVYFSLDDKKLVLKHYFRGGLPAVISKDSYLWTGIERSRAFKEWRLLKKMQALDLPVPSAVAAHVKRGLLTYRANLITEEIENADTLADTLIKGVLAEDVWFKIGACIKKFHLQDVYHSDLNARNILLTDDGEIYLIDFDNSYLRGASETWKRANLVRLQRSLFKFQRNHKAFNFNETNWSTLLRGYVAVL